MLHYTTEYEGLLHVSQHDCLESRPASRFSKKEIGIKKKLEIKNWRYEGLLGPRLIDR